MRTNLPITSQEFVLRDGMTIVSRTDLKGKITYINDDFIKNQFVILGESRFHAFVKKLDEQAFIYDDIATIKTAITKV